jgi:hypothetical protein
MTYQRLIVLKQYSHVFLSHIISFRVRHNLMYTIVGSSAEIDMYSGVLVVHTIIRHFLSSHISSVYLALTIHSLFLFSLSLVVKSDRHAHNVEEYDCIIDVHVEHNLTSTIRYYIIFYHASADIDLLGEHIGRTIDRKKGRKNE